MHFVVRLLWFLFIGWWLGLLWFGLSLALMVTIIFLPVGAWAATKTWKVMTLAGSDSPGEAINDVTVNVENKMKQEMSDKTEDDSSEEVDQYCENCGEALDEDAEFCPSCGEEV